MSWVSAGVSIGSALLGASGSRRAQKKADARAAQQSAYERDRDERIKLARGKIDTIFDSPQRVQQREQFADNLRGYLEQMLTRKRADTTRELKFGLARQGLTGGKVDIDKGRRLGEEFAEASIANERDVQGELAQLQAQDEQARNALKQAASGGMALSEASRRSNALAGTNLATADYGARVKGLGDVFADTAGTIKGIRERAELTRGYGYGARRNDLYGRQS